MRLLKLFLLHSLFCQFSQGAIEAILCYDQLRPSLMNLVFTAVRHFGKWSRPKPKVNKLKESKRSIAGSDDKAAKLSKSEQQLENKQRVIEEAKVNQETQRKIRIYKRQDISLEEYLAPKELDNILKHQKIYLKTGTGALLDTAKNMKNISIPYTTDNFEYLPNGRDKLNEKDQKFSTKKPPPGNYVKAINKKFQKEMKELPASQINEKLRRVGVLGTKLGMTTLWDNWGCVVPATVILLDRVQVVQIKEGNHPDFCQVQVGMGDVNLKNINRPKLGHFMKAGVPPKKKLAEFKVSRSCLLPIGHMMSVRHYTPGMLVDIMGKTVGHGFSGTIKRFGFRRQPETHGNSLTTRVLGSTGGHQDPGRVFKQKKMYGRMGGKLSVQRCMKVFKIDVDRNLMYIFGSVPGKAGSIVKIRDTVFPRRNQENLDLVSFPTFIEQPGRKYARQFSMYVGERDPGEIEIHDNSFIVDDGEDDSVTTATKDIPDD